MAAFFQLWNDETNNLIDEYDSEEDAAIEVRRRYQMGGERGLCELALLRFDDPATPSVIALRDDLLRYVADGDYPAHAPDAAG